MKTIDPNKVAIYVRWSTEDQKDGTTLQVQLEGCKHYILSQGWNVNDALIFIDDGFSGGNLNRPDLTKLRNKIKQYSIDCIVVFKLDRLSRSVIDTVNLVLDEWEGKTYLKSAREPIDTTTPMGKQFFYMLISYAEWERSVIRERTLSGKMTRAKEGKNSGFQYPYGYKKGSNLKFEIIPEEAEIVKTIYQNYLDGRGHIGIATDFNKKGIKFRKNKPWTSSYVAHILKNKTYIGILEYGKLTNNPTKNYKEKGEHRRLKNSEYISTESKFIEPIIDKETFNAVKKIRDSKNVNISKISGRSYSSEYLLTGILKCTCGHNCFGIKKSKKDKHEYYLCSGKKAKGKGFCDAGVIRQDLLDKIILNKIKEKFLVPENYLEIEKIILENYESEINNIKSEIKHIESNTKNLESQLIRIDNDYRNQNIDAATHNRLYNRVETEKKSANIKLAELKLQYQENLKNNIDINHIKKFPEMLNKWDNYSIIEQKNILRDLINKIIIYKKAGRYNTEIKILKITYWWDKEIVS